MVLSASFNSTAFLAIFSEQCVYMSARWFVASLKMHRSQRYKLLGEDFRKRDSSSPARVDLLCSWKRDTRVEWSGIDQSILSEILYTVRPTME